MVPHWFATTNYVEVTSPAGITVRVHEGKRRDPVGVVAFATSNESKARAYLHVSPVTAAVPIERHYDSVQVSFEGLENPKICSRVCKFVVHMHPGKVS